MGVGVGPSVRIFGVAAIALAGVVCGRLDAALAWANEPSAPISIVPPIPQPIPSGPLAPANPRTTTRLRAETTSCAALQRAVGAVDVALIEARGLVRAAYALTPRCDRDQYADRLLLTSLEGSRCFVGYSCVDIADRRAPSGDFERHPWGFESPRMLNPFDGDARWMR